MMDQPVVTTVLYVNGDVPSAAASPVASWSAAVTAEPSSSASCKTVIVYSIAVAMVGSATLTPESERKKKKEKTPPFEFLPEETVPSLSGQMIVFSSETRTTETTFLHTERFRELRRGRKLFRVSHASHERDGVCNSRCRRALKLAVLEAACAVVWSHVVAQLTAAVAFH